MLLKLANTVLILINKGPSNVNFLICRHQQSISDEGTRRILSLVWSNILCDSNNSKNINPIAKYKIFVVPLNTTDSDQAFLKFHVTDFHMYSRVWNKRSPLNKHSPLENLAKTISVAPFIPYTYITKIGTMESRIRL